MSRTIFYKEKFSTGPKITYLFLEVISALQARVGSEVDTRTLLKMAVVQAGLHEDPGDEFLLAVAKRIEAMKSGKSSDPMQQAPKKQGGGGKRGYGTDFLAMFDRLPIDKKCLYASDYDYKKARELYCVLDIAVTDDIIKTRIDIDFQEKMTAFEAVVYGMGGSFKGPSRISDGDVKVGANADNGAVASSAASMMSLINKRV